MLSLSTFKQISIYCQITTFILFFFENKKLLYLQYKTDIFKDCKHQCHYHIENRGPWNCIGFPCIGKWHYIVSDIIPDTLFWYNVIQQKVLNFRFSAISFYPQSILNWSKSLCMSNMSSKLSAQKYEMKKKLWFYFLKLNFISNVQKVTAKNSANWR